MATRDPQAAIAGTLAEPGLSTSEVEAIVQANDDLGALAGPVQTLIDIAVPTRLTQLSGPLPAATVSVQFSGLDLETHLAAVDTKLSGLSATAPRINLPPTISGTPVVGSTLTLNFAVTPTGITEGASGAHTNKYQVFGTPVGGQPISLTDVLTAGLGVASAPFQVLLAHKDLQLSVSQTPVDSPSGATGNSLQSLLTAAVTATPPANSGGANSPTVTHAGGTGSTANTTELTFNDGTWTNATGATKSYQPTLGGAALGPPQVSNKFIPGPQVVGAIGVIVTYTTGQGSFSIASSNAVTVTGTPVINFTTAPSLPSAPQIGVPILLSGGSTTGSTPDAKKTFQVFVEEGLGGVVTPYATITGEDPLYYTAEAPRNSYVKGKTGLDTLVGAHVRINQIPYVNNVAFPASNLSASRVVTAASTALVATVSIPTLNVTPNVNFSAIPVTIAGGVGPLVASNNGGVITGVSFDSSTGRFSGATTGANFSQTITVTWTDTGNGNVVATGSFQLVSTAASTVLVPIASIDSRDLFANMIGSYQALGGSGSLSSVNETTGLIGSGTIVGPYGPTNMRFGKIVDPVDSSRKCFFMAAKFSDGQTYNHYGRVEYILNAALQKSGVTYWIVTEMFLPSSRFVNGGKGTMMQIHNSTPPSTVFGPFQIGYYVGVFPNPGVGINRAWSTQSDPSLPGFNDNEFYPWITDNPGFPGNPITDGVTMTYGAYPTGKWVKFATRYRGDPTGTGGILQSWMLVDGIKTQIANLTNIQLGTAPQGFPTDYLKDGLNDEVVGGGSVGVWELRRGMKVYLDNVGANVDQYLAAS